VSLRPEQIKARQYLDQKGSRLTAAQLRDRVGAAFAAIEEALGSVEAQAARGRAIPGEWSVQEVVDHLVETHRPSIAELRDLLSGRRPEGPPIPAGLQSADPMAPEEGAISLRNTVTRRLRPPRDRPPARLPRGAPG